MVFLKLLFYKTKKPKKHLFCFLFLHIKNSKNIVSCFCFCCCLFHFRLASSFGTLVNFLASSFPLDCEGRLSFDFFFFFLSILVSYIKSSCFQELAFWTTKYELKLKEIFGKFHFVSRDFLHLRIYMLVVICIRCIESFS